MRKEPMRFIQRNGKVEVAVEPKLLTNVEKALEWLRFNKSKMNDFELENWYIAYNTIKAYITNQDIYYAKLEILYEMVEKDRDKLRLKIDKTEPIFNHLLEVHDKFNDGRLHKNGFGTMCDGIMHDYKQQIIKER